MVTFLSVSPIKVLLRNYTEVSKYCLKGTLTKINRPERHIVPGASRHQVLSLVSQGYEGLAQCFYVLSSYCASHW